ncbi:MAG: peptidase M48 Ste24p [Desulfobacteraceae bacterium]|nr:MAG: peptidase M48 Ste24p [Desulfobacteraceae bacterium]
MSETRHHPATYRLTRREFLHITALSAAGFAAGCAVNPVTGKSQLILVSEGKEIQMDQQSSPYQLSADFGKIQDSSLNDYLNRTGKAIAAKTHRPGMPYSFQGVNATYVNAYAFPGGTIAATRGILLSLDNEAELAALFGHELGHVNARHTAQQMSKSMLTQAVVGGLAVYAGTRDPAYSQVASTLGMLGAGALLASYSRDNERQADSLALEYMTKSGYNPDGCTGLMDMLRSMSKQKPNVLELMFSTHPMSDERYRDTVEEIGAKYPADQNKPVYRERYMDHTAGLRKIKSAIESMQNGERQMAGQKYGEAEESFTRALSAAPDDYAGLMMMAQCQIMMKNDTRAEQFAEKAGHVYPQEPGSHYLNGLSKLNRKKFDQAYAQFEQYDQKLPGNPNLTFFKGFCLEKTGRERTAAGHYQTYLQAVNQGEKAQYAYQKLIDWGYIKPPAK